MRLRAPEAWEERGLTTYRLALQSGGRLNMQSLYRLKRARGRVSSFDADVLQALADILGVGPSELLESESADASTKKAARRKASR